MTSASASAPVEVESSPPFSRTLREATAGSHSLAEGSRYLDALLGGRLTATQYAVMVAQHWFIYEELESVGDDMAGDSVAGGFIDRSLRRTPSLEADLVVLLGGDWRSRVSALPATGEYVDRLRSVGRDGSSARFVAHHYTRYMGDLSGGQFIGRGLRDVFGFGDDRATTFYTFEAIDDLVAYKDAYRERLDSADWSADQRTAMVDETLEAYRLNTAVFADLAREVA